MSPWFGNHPAGDVVLLRDAVADEVLIPSVWRCSQAIPARVALFDLWARGTCGRLRLGFRGEAAGADVLVPETRFLAFQGT